MKEIRTKLKQRADKYINQLKPDWERITKEPITIEYKPTCFYAFGSELAVLRLLNHYKDTSLYRNVGYSENLETWFFAIELF